MWVTPGIVLTGGCVPFALPQLLACGLCCSGWNMWAHLGFNELFSPLRMNYLSW